MERPCRLLSGRIAIQSVGRVFRDPTPGARREARPPPDSLGPRPSSFASFAFAFACFAIQSVGRVFRDPKRRSRLPRSKAWGAPLAIQSLGRVSRDPKPRARLSRSKASGASLAIQSLGRAFRDPKPGARLSRSKAWSAVKSVSRDPRPGARREARRGPRPIAAGRAYRLSRLSRSLSRLSAS